MDDDSKKIHDAYQNLNNNEQNNDSDWEDFYHAGPRKIKAKSIEFDLGAMGFHLGSSNLMSHMVKGIHKKNVLLPYQKSLPVSKFKVNLNPNHTVELNSDMPWEDARFMVVYLKAEGVLNINDAKEILSEFGYEDNSENIDIYDPDYEEDFNDLLFKSLNRKYYHNYDPSDDIGLLDHNSEFFKDRESLSFLREYLVNTYGYKVILYPNEAEGIFVGGNELSVCVLDKSVIIDT